MDSQPAVESACARFEFSGVIWYWRGPAPFHFLTVPEAQSKELKAMLPLLTYGWGMIPVLMRLGETRWETSLWPKDGGYVVPVKDAVRKPERLSLGDVVDVHLVIDV